MRKTLTTEDNINYYKEYKFIVSVMKIVQLTDVGHTNKALYVYM